MQSGISQLAQFPTFYAGLAKWSKGGPTKEVGGTQETTRDSKSSGCGAKNIFEEQEDQIFW